MPVKVKGFKEVSDYFDKLAKVGDKSVKNALDLAAEEVRKAEVSEAKKHDRYSQNVGYNELKKYPVRFGKMGSRYVSVGIRAKSPSASQKKKEQKAAASGDSRATYWDKVKGLWYNNYGFYHNKSGNYIAGSNWIDDAYEKSVDKAYKIIKDELMRDMK